MLCTTTTFIDPIKLRNTALSQPPIFACYLQKMNPAIHVSKAKEHSCSKSQHLEHSMKETSELSPCVQLQKTLLSLELDRSEPW